MSGIILTTRDPSGPPIDMTGVLPERLAAGGREALAGLTLLRGRERHRLDTLFTLEDGGHPGSLVLRPGGAVLDGVGTGMSTGEIRVEGDCGAYAGSAMSGGTLTIEGNCGAFVAAEMSGGRLRVAGDAGDFLGAPLAGGTRGMSGGTVVVMGNAGERVGERMRRGLIAVHGRVGSLCGARMIAGTIVVGTGCGPDAGQAMRRGSILLQRALESVPSGFVDGGMNDWLFLDLMRKELIDGGAWPSGFPTAGTRARRLIGDRTAGGIGEVLILAEA
ncbi:formylmethanofuran dehydrogenase subunit C [Azospirillum formosense]|uniref:Formylmethanofuran dehydrogenase subunit C n=1 Tax=Azospirillum formosense TaxID=861533 RepID=A0ABX2KPI5_9PROT|nr:formylmethanofuran dehydrogenase subunit C [Azospirillum formosense]MBY3756310.1 formylmethanofuran dehydrogenase subunit C [Azospirillum formosense]NUB18548.1 formylmethanofuran dehydrogenase subunit C [Azospirillum formosense]